MKEHELKTDPQVFDAVVNGYTTQIRKNLVELINGYLPSEYSEEASALTQTLGVE